MIGRLLPLKQSLKHVAFGAYAAAQSALRGPQPPLSEISSFLLLQYPAALGAALHATPVLPALRAAVPNAEITVCASGFALDVLRYNLAIDRLVETPNPTRQFGPAVRAIRNALPARRPFATITTTANERSTIPLAASLAGATSFVGFTLLPELYRARIVYDKTQSQIANNLRIIAALGHQPSAPFEPQASSSADDLAYALTLLQRFDDPLRPFAVLVTQTSVTQRKGWRPERFAAVADHLIQQHGMNLLLLGAPSERPAVQALTDRIGPRSRNIAGETTLPQLAALLSLGSVGVTLDTGILHIGRAVGLPMAVIAPAWSPPVEWLPLDNPRYVILKNLDMSTSPPDYIIDEVSVDEVNAALDQLLGSYPAKELCYHQG